MTRHRDPQSMSAISREVSSSMAEARMRATTVGVALMCLTLVGCSDSTGMIDDAVHNGFDQSTCTDLKALALDVQYQGVTATEGKARATLINAESAKAGDPTVRQAAAGYISAYLSGNQQSLPPAVTQFVKVCHF